MVVSVSIYRSLLAHLLLGLVLLSSTGKTVHILTNNHHHEPLKVCSNEAETREGTPHFHDAHYLTEDCSVCDYLIGAHTLPTLDYWVLPVPTDWVVAVKTYTLPLLASTPTATHRQRGPPVFSGCF